VGPGSRLLVALVLSAVLLSLPAGASASSRDLGPYSGLATWLDIYAGKSAWSNPGRVVAAMDRDGARTLFIETGNYRQSVDLVRPRAQGRFLDAAHAAGLRVVAWYLPSFAGLGQDERRALAAIRFQSPSGEHFDGFALDIEATVVRDKALRNRRLLQLSARLRSEVGPDYALGAIIPSPIGMSPSYWPHIPYRALARVYDVFLPMAYFTFRGVRGSKATLAYLSATVAAVRNGTGDPTVPIHLIGGLSGGMATPETVGFMRAVATCAPLGYSLYSFPTTRRSMWTTLKASLPARATGARSCT
jgi:hypothetical protein